MNKKEALEWCKENDYLNKGEVLFLDDRFGWMVADSDPVPLICCDLNKADEKCPCGNECESQG